MLRVESAVACDGKDGTYSLYLHYLAARRVAALMHLLLPSRPDKVERELNLFAEPDFWAMLQLAEGVNHMQAQQLKKVAAPALITVVRSCDRLSHADGATSDTRRTERAAAVLGTPSVSLAIEITPGLVQLDDRGIGRAPAVNKMLGSMEPVVSAPLTRAERLAFARSSTGLVLPALLSSRPDNVIYGVLHPDFQGGFIEQLHVEDVHDLS